MPDRLPPLTALRAFEAAARHMSFAKAAEELFVTPAALSYQIKQLEEFLGVPVFRRLNRAVELTEAGLALNPGVSMAFDSLRQATRAVAKLQADEPLTITAGPAFTAKWLAPRFYRFHECHPEIELRFVATLRIMDFLRDGVDAAIRFAENVEDTVYSEVLAEEWITPVCTKEVAARIAGTNDLSGETLLHDESIQSFTPAPDWPAWARVSGMEGDWAHGPRFSNADHAIDGALEGAGIVLGRIVLVERYLANERLVVPFKLAMRPRAQFFFVCPKGSELSGRVSVLLDWMREEISHTEKFSADMEIVDL
ncbi:MAG: transcriptional regulator GcvA [Pseudomonadota bacterium]